MTIPQSTIPGVANTSGCDVQLRAVPYPYRAMLAICSDLDETPDRQVYELIARFLNTTDTTPMGEGVGLEVGNTIYFDMPNDQFAYWNTDDAGRELARALIRSGHIDCLHSYGDLATTREHAGRALDELARHDCQLEVWIDHGTAVTNFDPDIMHGHGDEVGHEAYHADLTTDYGIKYVWRGRVTSVLGQDVPARLASIWNSGHPVASGQTWLKEWTKRQLARVGNTKYAMHGPNETLRATILRDDNPVHEFMRCNPHWGGVSSCDQGRHIGKVVTREMLARLVERGGTCVLYTHLGKIDDPCVPFNEDAAAAFRRLAEEYDAGRILVTTTRRLLGYRRAVTEGRLNCIANETGETICLSTEGSQGLDGELSAADLAGLTFYVPHPERTRVTVGDSEIENLTCNPPDDTGRASVSLPWSKLEFPTI